MTRSPHRQRASLPELPPVDGMSVEVWSWLRESMAVRPHVVARVRAALDSGEQATPEQVALAIMNDPVWALA